MVQAVRIRTPLSSRYAIPIKMIAVQSWIATLAVRVNRFEPANRYLSTRKNSRGIAIRCSLCWENKLCKITLGVGSPPHSSENSIPLYECAIATSVEMKIKTPIAREKYERSIPLSPRAIFRNLLDDFQISDWFGSPRGKIKSNCISGRCQARLTGGLLTIHWS